MKKFSLLWKIENVNFRIECLQPVCDLFLFAPNVLIKTTAYIAVYVEWIRLSIWNGIHSDVRLWSILRYKAARVLIPLTLGPGSYSTRSILHSPLCIMWLFCMLHLISTLNTWSYLDCLRHGELSNCMVSLSSLLNVLELCFTISFL